MKKYITILFLAMGISTFSYAQTASIGKKESVRSHKSFVKHTSHFSHPKKRDKKLAHNGTLVFRELHAKKCHPDSIVFSERGTKQAKRKWRKRMNPTFGTYTMR